MQPWRRPTHALSILPTHRTNLRCTLQAPRPHSLMSAEKLRKRMSASKSGWGWNDLDRIYLSYGFTKREGSKHTVYSHPAYRQLRATVARHRSLPKGYITIALRLINELERLQKTNADDRQHR